MAPRIPKRNARFIDVEGEMARGMSALEALRGYAGAPSQASVMVPGALSAYEGGELAGMAEMLIPGASLAKGALGAALAGVIKPRGGNWLTGSVGDALGPLRRQEYRPESIQLQRDALEIGRQRGYDDGMIQELERAVQQREAPVALNRWIEGPLAKYVKRDMATPEDPVRRLAEDGVVHYSPEIDVNSPTLQGLRSTAGFPPEGLGRSEAAKQWEAMSDMQPVIRMGRDFPEGIASFMDEETLAGNPWLANLGPDDNVYSFNKRHPPNQALGFDHLVDELSNAMDPESGLPRNLLLRPEQMQQMGMEKAVRHVDAINKWRAAQEVAANAELANKAMVLREYPDTPEMPNPKGLRWMELKADNNFDRNVPPPDDTEWVDTPDGPMLEHLDSGEMFHPGYIDLQKQLKYEGDTMGHCVGGYCPDVLEGRSRIFSLRDAKGEPHVTVEVNPEDTRKFLDEEEKNPEVQSFYNRVQSILDKRGAEEIPELEYVNMIKELPSYKNWLSNRQGMPSFKINQIKGKQNQAPKDDYLPFVQDFVRNNPLGGSWTDVGDLRNTGLRKVGDKYVTLDELKDVPRNGLGLPIGYEPLDDLPAWKDGGVVEFPKITPKAMLNRVISAYNAL